MLDRSNHKRLRIILLLRVGLMDILFCSHNLQNLTKKTCYKKLPLQAFVGFARAFVVSFVFVVFAIAPGGVFLRLLRAF